MRHLVPFLLLAACSTSAATTDADCYDNHGDGSICMRATCSADTVTCPPGYSVEACDMPYVCVVGSALCHGVQAWCQPR